MGITNLFKFIKTKYPHILHKKYLFKVAFGNKILIDISSYIYKYKAIYKDKWLYAFIKFILFFKIKNLHIAFVFDGKANILKDEERKRRFIEKEKLQDKASRLYKDLEEYKNTGKQSELLIETMKKIIEKKSKKDDKVKKLLHTQKKEKETNIELDVKLLEGRLVEIEGQIINVTDEDIFNLKKILTYLGIPYLQSNCEAETLATYLCNTNQANIIISEDSDVLAYLNEDQISISKLDPKNGTCIVIYMKELLAELKMKKLEFLDFCILSGTDYNENIYKVGSVGSFNYISKYKTIENFIKKVNNDIKKPLEFDRIKKYKEIRDIFIYKEIPNGKLYSDLDDNNNNSNNNNNNNEESYIIKNIPLCNHNVNLEKCFDFLETLNINLHKEIKNAWT